MISATQQKHGSGPPVNPVLLLGPASRLGLQGPDW